MKTKRFSIERIVRVLKKAETMSIRDLCQQHGISTQTYHRWSRDYGGMDVAKAREVKQLRHENLKLRRLVADLALSQRRRLTR